MIRFPLVHAVRPSLSQVDLCSFLEVFTRQEGVPDGIIERMEATVCFDLEERPKDKLASCRVDG